VAHLTGGPSGVTPLQGARPPRAHRKARSEAAMRARIGSRFGAPSRRQRIHYSAVLSSMDGARNIRVRSGGWVWTTACCIPCGKQQNSPGPIVCLPGSAVHPSDETRHVEQVAGHHSTTAGSAPDSGATSFDPTESPAGSTATAATRADQAPDDAEASPSTGRTPGGADGVFFTYDPTCQEHSATWYNRDQ
jgi:hypothetical protein